MNKHLLYIIIALVVLACSSTKKTLPENLAISEAEIKKEILTPIDIYSPTYNPSQERLNDLLHTKLDVKFDYANAQLHGKATLTLKPYFYPSSSLKLDAKGFSISKVEFLTNDDKFIGQAKYSYDGNILDIDLGKTYFRTDTFKVFIDYVAKPNERQTKGSKAIASDKGLYFINPLGGDSTKPIQIWTQGETQSNSAWFPTIDSPNERMTQEIFITVDNKFQTLSNGTLQFSIENDDSTRTDYWKQELPHAPYLTMMAIADYAVIKDKWRNIEVNYYVEKKYQPYAKEIFGNTPQMLEFFSNKLGVEYPWEKYHQVTVRDYVSGAMENTTAVVFGEYIQRTHREMIDENDENIIAHELFHHWFGDLVTCESWANIPLNESFATYGEYLWEENKYGREQADFHNQEGLNNYLAESRQKQVNMIRFDYNVIEEVFDSHSYAKGGRILHMLRKHVGDQAFFESLKLYLESNKYNTVEIHQLRLAFEKVTGRDLNWFFNQWFFASGHPILTISNAYDSINKKVTVSISQDQDMESTPIYEIPLQVDIYLGNNKTSHNIKVSKLNELFSFNADQKPDLVNVDAEKMLLGLKNETKTATEWAFQYRNAPLYLDRYEAIENIIKTNDSLSFEIINEALNDKFWNIRILALKQTRKLQKEHPVAIKSKLISIIKNDPSSKVRAAAIKQLAVIEQDKISTEIYKAALKDSSYSVMADALNALSTISGKEALEEAKTLEKEESSKLKVSIAGIYSAYGGNNENAFFVNAIKTLNGFNRYGVISLYPQLLSKCNDENINLGATVLTDQVKNPSIWWLQLISAQALTQVYDIYLKRELDLKEFSNKTLAGSAEAIELEKKINDNNAQKNKIFALLREIRNTEKNEQLIQLLEDFK